MKLTGIQYYEVADKYVLSLLGETGYIWGFNQDVKISDRFFLGSDTMRGFEYAGFGPRDLTNGADDALGGNHYYRGTLELTMPTFLPTEMGFKGHIFSDAAVLGKNDEKPSSTDLYMNEEDPRVSIGVGLSWASPFGPLRLDFAKPVMKKSYDKTELIHFSFGTKF
jgi:outer membrane protein insertion porin family